MHKILIYTIAFVFLMSSLAIAVDKKSDKKKERSKVDTLIKARDTRIQSPTGNQPKDYNDFIDKNNNGIDDRAENQQKVSPKKTDTSKTKSKSADSQSQQKK